MKFLKISKIRQIKIYEMLLLLYNFSKEMKLSAINQNELRKNQ